MGKPIADRGKFPFGPDGILVNGAMYDGQAFSKTLHIYKQRSYNMYDLIDDAGVIYQYMLITWMDANDNVLDYYDVDTNLSTTLKNKTFYIKEQDPSNGIYGFSTLYQLNKVKIHDGNYIFKKDGEYDYSLLGIRVFPNNTVLTVGQSANIIPEPIPIDYSNSEGSWTFSDSSLIEHNGEETDGLLNIKGLKPGQLIASFTPFINPTVTAHSLITIVEDDTPLNSITGIIDDPRTVNYAYSLNEEFTIQLISEPFGIALPEASDIRYDKNRFDLAQVSSDNKRYTFKVINDDGAAPFDQSNLTHRYNPFPITFTVNGQSYSVSYENIRIYIVKKTEVSTFIIRGNTNIKYQVPSPFEATFDSNKFYFPNDPDNQIEWFIKTKNIGDNGILESTGTFTANYTSPPPRNAWRELSVRYKGVESYGVTVWFADLADSVQIHPVEQIVIHEGEKLQLSTVFKPDGYPNTGGFIIANYQEVYKDYYTLSSDGLITVFDNIPKNIEIRPAFVTYGAISTGSSTITKYMCLMKEEVLPTSISAIPRTSRYIPLNSTIFINTKLTPMVNSYPNISYELSDPSIFEIDEDAVRYSLNSSWGNGGGNSGITAKGIKKGTCTIKIWCTDKPDVFTTITLNVY